MADNTQETIRLLGLIERNTAKNTGGASKKIGSIGNSEQFKDKMEESASNLTKSYEKLNKAIDENQKAMDAAAQRSKDRVKADDELNKRVEALRKNIDEQVKSGDNLNTIKRKNADALSDLTKRGVDFSGILNNTSIELTQLSGGINDHFNALQQITKEEEEYAKTVKNLDEVTKNHQKIEEQIYNETMGNVKRGLKSFAAALQVLAIRMTHVFGEMQSSGFESGGFGGIMSLMKQSVLMGASPEEVTRFAAQNRDIITSITKTASLSADESAAAIESFGEVVQDTFGVVGQKQLQMVGQGLKTLTNLGIPATVSNFKELNQSIETMAKTSNMTAEELYAEFSNLADDSGFQGIIHSLGGTKNAATMLQETFKYLQTEVGANAEEFMKYQKHLAEQRKRAGVERVVQGRFAQELAAELGGFTNSEVELIRRGTAFTGALSTERGPNDEASELDRYIALMMEMETKVGKGRSEAIRLEEEGVAQLERYRIYMEKIGLQENVARALRKQAEVTGAVADAQAVRSEASKKDTDPLLKYAADLNELVSGLSKSPLFQSGLFSVLMFTSVYQAVKLGMVRAWGESLLKAGYKRSTGVINPLKNAPRTSTPMRANLATLQPNTARIISNTGRSATKLGAIAGKLGRVARVAGKVALPISAVIGTFEGLNAAMNQEGNALEKALAGFSAGVNSITLGLTGWVAKQMDEDTRTFGESIYNFYNPTVDDMTQIEQNDARERRADLMQANEEEYNERRREYEQAKEAYENEQNERSKRQLEVAEEQLLQTMDLNTKLNNAPLDSPLLAPTKPKGGRSNIGLGI